MNIINLLDLPIEIIITIIKDLRIESLLLLYNVNSYMRKLLNSQYFINLVNTQYKLSDPKSFYQLAVLILSKFTPCQLYKQYIFFIIKRRSFVKPYFDDLLVLSKFMSIYNIKYEMKSFDQLIKVINMVSKAALISAKKLVENITTVDESHPIILKNQVILRNSLTCSKDTDYRRHCCMSRLYKNLTRDELYFILQNFNLNPNLYVSSDVDTIWNDIVSKSKQLTVTFHEK